MAKSSTKLVKDLVRLMDTKSRPTKETFGEGTYASRAEAALPGILERIQMQEVARLQNVPTLGLLSVMQGGQTGQSQMSMPQQGFLQNLATQGMGQISQGQTMNPTILKAKV